jgi:hypothetical protein
LTPRHNFFFLGMLKSRPRHVKKKQQKSVLKEIRLDFLIWQEKLI